MTLPPAVPKPCNECPFLRTSAPGYVGPYPPKTWCETAHGEGPIACHMTIKHTDNDGEGDWSDPEIRQCRGAAMFRANICKSPRDPEIETGPADRTLVFGWDNEFITHHSKGEP